MAQLDVTTTEYLGETIKLLSTNRGWCAWWVHPVIGAFGDGAVHPTAEQALDSIQELIRRNGAIDELLILIDQLQETGVISELEHNRLEVSLLGYAVS